MSSINQDEQTGALPVGSSEQTPEEITPASEVQGQQPEDASQPSQQDQADEGQEQVTDRGTKVAKEPESKFYQQIKNENADMRALLGNQNALKEYMRTFEGTAAPKQGEVDDLSDIADKVLGQDGQVDLGKLAQYMEERVMSKVEKAVQFHTQNQIRSREIETTYTSDKTSVRQAHPELDPSNKDTFDPELDQLVGERFIAQGGLEGKVTLKDVADKTFAGIEKWRGAGRKQAETEIVRKRAGAIPQAKAQGDAKESEEENMSPSQILTARLQKQVAGAKR